MCVYIEAVVLPQLRMMQKAKVVERFTANYVFAWHGEIFVVRDRMHRFSTAVVSLTPLPGTLAGHGSA